jgi:mannose-6-phosphate isomerase
MSERTEKRPWGSFCVLSDEIDHKVKRITVKPKKRLSLQSHKRRSEHWYIVKGRGVVTVDDKKVRVKAGTAADIPKGARHRAENTGTCPLIFIEVQTGNYFDEDDIIRYEDDFGRVR